MMFFACFNFWAKIRLQWYNKVLCFNKCFYRGKIPAIKVTFPTNATILLAEIRNSLTKNIPVLSNEEKMWGKNQNNCEWWMMKFHSAEDRTAGCSPDVSLGCSSSMQSRPWLPRPLSFVDGDFRWFFSVNAIRSVQLTTTVIWWLARVIWIS